jgi:hypothetical protein
MTKFETFNPVAQLSGLARAAQALQREEQVREDQLVLFDPVQIEAEEKARLEDAKKPRRNRKRVN